MKSRMSVEWLPPTKSVSIRIVTKRMALHPNVWTRYCATPKGSKGFVAHDETVLKNNVVTCSKEMTMNLTQNECLFKIHKRKDSPKNLWLDLVKKRMVRLDDRRRDRSAVAWKRKQVPTRRLHSAVCCRFVFSPLTL
jgi:hypothetical protein